MGYTKQEWLKKMFRQGDRIEVIELIDMLKTNRSSSASDAYVRLAEKILEE